MADEEQTSQGASAAPESTPAGTTDTSVTDASAQTQESPEAPTPDGIAVEANASVEEKAPDETDQSRSTRERRERQRANRQKETPPEPVKSREEIRAEILREENERQARDQAIREERAQFDQWTGDGRSNPNDPNSPTDYEQALADSRTPLPPDLYQTDLEEANRINAKITEARSKLARFDEFRGFLGRVEEPVKQARQAAIPQARVEAMDWVGQQFELGLAEFPELNAQAIFDAGKGQADPMPAVVKALASAIREQIAPDLAEAREDLEAANSEIDALRRQLGGHAPQPERGGVPGTNGHGSVVQRLIQQAGSQEAYIERAMRGDYAGVDLSK